MKTTKDIAELFSDEIERIAQGEIRKDVISGLERCSNALVKLARLEMDYAWKAWDDQKPEVPWLGTASKRESDQTPKKIQDKPQDAMTNAIREGVDEILGSKKEIADKLQVAIKALEKARKNGQTTLVCILEDKVEKLQHELTDES